LGRDRKHIEPSTSKPKSSEKTMANSTSIHHLNADHGLNKIQRGIWKLLNLINNNYFPNRSGDLCVRSFCPEIVEKDWEKIHVRSSAGRSLSDLFWLKIDWKAVKSELGSINVLDTGAGNGKYALKLNDFAEGISSYLGTDLKPREDWQDIMCQHRFITLRKQHSNDLSKVVPQKTNFFMTQAAIEHFEDDLLYFSQVRNFIEHTNANTIQVHTFPAAACLRLYAYHGVRQYTPRTVSKIVQLFASPHTYSILFKLGGKNCNDFHYRSITYPMSIRTVDWRDSKLEEYRTLLRNAVEKDIDCRSNQPTFYALVIHSNFKEPIFKTMTSLTRCCP